MSTNNFSKEIILITLLFILAFLLRLTSLYKYPLANDFLTHWQETKIIAEGQIVLAGPIASVNTNFRQGPFYYYLLYFLQIISHFNDRFVVFFFALLNSFTLFPLLAICKYFMDKRTTFFIPFIFAINPYLISIGGSPWNPNIIPLLTTSALYLSLLIKKEQKIKFIPSLFVLLAMIIQSHLTATPIALFLLWYSFDQHDWEKSLKFYIYGFSLFFICWLPYFIYQIQNNWQPIFSLFTNYQSKNNQSCTFIWWLKNHGHGETCFHYLRNTLFVFRSLSIQTFGERNLFLTFVSLLIVGFFSFINWKKSTVKLTIALIFTITFYFFYKSYIYIHYFNDLFPLGLIFLGNIIDWTKKHQNRIFGELIIWSTVITNIYFLSKYLI